MKLVLRTLALLALPASFLGAQVQPKTFSVTTRIGAQKAERAASLETAGVLGLDTEYSLSKFFAVGTTFDVSRGNTTKEDFLGRYRYGNAGTGSGDSIFYQYLGQPVHIVNLGAFGMLRLPAKTVSPFVMGGVGTYVMLLDTQVNGSAKRKNDMSYTFGGGLWIKLTEKTGLQFDARALTLTKYDRKFLDPSKGRLPNFSFPQDFETPPAAKNTALNTMFTVGFRYIPAGIGGRN